MQPGKHILSVRHRLRRKKEAFFSSRVLGLNKRQLKIKTRQGQTQLYFVAWVFYSRLFWHPNWLLNQKEPTSCFESKAGNLAPCGYQDKVTQTSHYWPQSLELTNSFHKKITFLGGEASRSRPRRSFGAVTPVTSATSRQGISLEIRIGFLHGGRVSLSSGSTSWVQTRQDKESWVQSRIRSNHTNPGCSASWLYQQLDAQVQFAKD